jgi:hypothetical protein
MISIFSLVRVLVRNAIFIKQESEHFRLLRLPHYEVGVFRVCMCVVRMYFGHIILVPRVTP